MENFSQGRKNLWISKDVSNLRRSFTKSYFSAALNQLLTVADKPSVKISKIYNRLRDYCRQYSAIAADPILRRLISESENAPPEGARIKSGTILRHYSNDGKQKVYRVFGLDSGGFSNVYRAIETVSMKPVCLKEHRATHSDEICNNFVIIRENEIISALSPHPNILETYGTFNYRGRVILITEYIAGSSLGRLMKKGALGIPTALYYAEQICQAMIHARSVLQGFFHGDIKPGNCLVTAENTLKLIDYGQSGADIFYQNAENANEPKEFPKLKEKKWGGTQNYMAPELSGCTFRERPLADIYAFGVTFFEMLTGNDLKRFNKNPESKPKSLLFAEDLSERTEIPADLAALICRCVAQNPADRPADFAEIARCLKKNAAGVFKGKTSSERIAVEEKAFVESRSEQQLTIQNDNFFNGTDDKRFSVNQLFLHAAKLFRRKRFAESCAFLDQILKNDAGNTAAINLKTEILLLSNREIEAVRLIKRSLLFDAEQTFAYHRLAEYYRLRGKLQKAAKYNEQAIIREPFNGELYRFSGRLSEALGLWKSALDYYKKALRYGAEQKSSRKEYLQICLQIIEMSGRKPASNHLKVIDRASEFLSNCEISDGSELIKILSDISNDEDLLLMVGLVDDALIKVSTNTINGFVEKLRALAERGLKINKDFPLDPYYSAAKILYEFGFYADSENLLRRSLKVFGRDERIFYYLAACREMREDFQTALKYYRKAQKINANCELNRTGVNRMRSGLRTQKDALKKSETYREL